MITKEKFGTNKDGLDVNIYTLSNLNNMKVKLTEIGATIVSIVVPNTLGELIDVVLGFDDLSGYQVNSPVFGSIVGRSVNRIEGAYFELDEDKYFLDKNDGENNLHSGNKSHTKIWKVKEINEGKNQITFSLLMEDGFQGFPGNFYIDVKYSLTEENELIIEYMGNCDKKTIANFTNHSYFNLDGHNQGDILEHNLKIYAKEFTPLKDNVNIPSGEIRSVLNTPFDFTEFKKIGLEIDSQDLQIEIGRGYDHNFVLDKKDREFTKIAEVFSDKTKILMEVFTDLDGVQFYTGNFLDGKLKGKENTFYEKRAGLCLETQHFPNAINIENFKSPILNEGEDYYTKTVYKFGIVQE